MRRAICGICIALLFAPFLAQAESKNPEDYPLRLHIYERNETTFYRSNMPGQTRGDGRANLFANGGVHGVDFIFDCGEDIKTSIGYETYPAKWKKPSQELIVLMPVFGRTGNYFTCNFKVDVKDYVYIMHNGRIGPEPSAGLLTWMAKHEYDPEHGKTTPVQPPTQTAGGSGTPAPAVSGSTPAPATNSGTPAAPPSPASTPASPKP